MLSLFMDQGPKLNQTDPITRAREILISSLNKGHIPSWDEYFAELPQLESAEHLETIKETFLKLIYWPFLIEALKSNATEYFFHGPENSQEMDHQGNKKTIEVPIQKEDWQIWLEVISIHFKQNWNVEHPFCSFYGILGENKYRITMIHASTSPNGISKIVLRNLSQRPFPIAAFGANHLMEELVQKKANILIAGSTGSGKTSLMSSLTSFLKEDEHLVILEDTFEINSEHRYQTRFIAGSSPQTSLKAFLSYSLRITPDRILLGEMRSHEVVPFLMAMNTGHKGLMGTIHASSAYDALNRFSLLFTLYSAESNLPYDKIMELICRNLEYVVFMENKRVKEVIKILGSEKGVAFYESVFTQEALVAI